MIAPVKVRLVCPHEGKFNPMDAEFKCGGGFRTCLVTYSVNPVGSASLYKLVSVEREGVQLDVESVERLNPPSAIDEVIGKTFSEYREKVQQLPAPKKRPLNVAKKKAEPEQYLLPE